MNKIYRLHDHKGRFLFEVSTFENCLKNAEVLYGSRTLGIIDAYETEEGNYIVNVEVIKEEKTALYH